jgi:hypothetical protein
VLSLYGLNGPENIDIPLAYNVKGIASGAYAENHKNNQLETVKMTS